MSQFFYDFQTLKKGTQCMVDTLATCYTQMQTKNVSPNVEPGFLRNEFDEHAPQKGKPIQQVIRETKQKIFPGIMYWQSAKFFGYFPSSIAVSSVIAQMFASTFHSPAFNYAVSPSHTQLQNIQMDWCASALGLPQVFYLKNSGGGIINNSTTESVLVSVHAAKRKKMSELQINQINPQMLKFVGYYSQISHNGAQRGLLMKQIFYRRPVRVNYNNQTHNYQLDINHFEQLLSKDIQGGLIPFWFGATYGSTLSGAIDFNRTLVQICKKHKIWLNLDAAYLGSTWICQQFRPQKGLLEEVDSLQINFSKVLLSGTGGSLMFIKDKQQLNKAFGGTAQFSFYQNKFTGRNDVVDYKDWIFGLARRNNAIKFFFMFQHYGLQNLRKLIKQTTHKADQLQKWIVEENKQIYELYSRSFGLICFRAKTKDGIVSDILTKTINDQIRNIQQGYSSPGSFKGVNMIRIVIGNYHSDTKVIRKYFEKIVEKTIELQKQFIQQK